MKPTEDTPLNIQDERLLDFLWIDREIRRPSPNGKTWLALIQPTCASILLCLCSHAGKTRESFPSYATIAEECGISRQSAIDGIAVLISFGFLRKGESTKHRTNTFIIQAREKWCVPANAGRKARKDKGSPNPKRHHYKQDSQSDRLSKNDVIVNQIDSDSQSDRPLIVNQIDSDSQSDRPEVKSLKKSHLKESQREREPENANSNAEKNALSLSSSPSWDIFCLFFKEESKRLSDFQRKTICDIPDSQLLKQAIEHLLGNGYSGAWNKISLIKKVMQELAAAASVQPSAGAGGAASPARFGQDVALLDDRGNPKAFTMKAKQARANMAFFDNILTAAASEVIDIQPLTAIAGA